MNFGEIPNFGDFGGNPGVWFLVLPTNYIYTTIIHILRMRARTLHIKFAEALFTTPMSCKTPPRSEMCLLALALATLETCNGASCADYDSRATDNIKMATSKSMKAGGSEEFT